MSKTIVSRTKTWAANANGRYGWCFKIEWSDGTTTWEFY